MIDKVKRNTLKRISMSAAAVAAAGVSGQSLASLNHLSGSPSPDVNALPLADIQIHTRVSAVTNDLEVLVTNTGSSSTTITQLTPSVTVTKRGKFNFSQLLKNGNLTLAPGQSMSVPMTPHAVSVSSLETMNGQSQSLSEALRRSFSVVTENDAFAKVNVIEGMQFA